MSIRVSKLATLAVGPLLFGLLSNASAEAAIIRRSFTLDTGLPYTGTGSFEYDDTTLQSLGDPSGNLFASIQNVLFQYTGETEQSINDPFAAANFDSLGNFLGLDLELPAPFGQSGSVLIANENVYLGEDFNQLVSNGVRYEKSVPVAIPTPVLLPGLIGMGFQVVRRKRVAAKDENRNPMTV